MRSRPRLITSIPFWVLIAGSLAVIGAGLWNVFRGVDAMGQVLTNPNATVVEVYVAQTWAIVGGGLTAAGIVGLFIALAIAAASVLVPRPDVAIESIDWSSDDETALDASPSNVSRTAPADAPSASGSTPVALEDPDVETSSNTPAPPQAAAAARADAAEDPARN